MSPSRPGGQAAGGADPGLPDRTLREMRAKAFEMLLLVEQERGDPEKTLENLHAYLDALERYYWAAYGPHPRAGS